MEGGSSREQARAGRMVAAITVAFAVYAGAMSVVSPSFESPDELSHAEYAAFIAERGRLPTLRDDCVRLAFHPPLYHVLIAAIARATGTTVEAVRAGHTRNAAFPAQPNVLLHGYADEAFPWAGVSRFVHLARLATVLLALPIIVVTWRAAALALARPSGGVVAAAIVAAVPQLAYLAATVNHDVLAASCASVALLLLAEIAARGLDARRTVAAGIATGLGVLTKTSVVVLVPVAALAFLLAPRAPLRARAGAACLFAALVVALTGWWFARMLADHGTFFPLVRLVRDTWVGTDLVRTTPFDARSALDALAQTWRSFWFVGGLMNVPAAPWMYVVWAAITIVGIAGVPSLLRVRAGLILVVAALAVVAAVLQYNVAVYSSQGRYLFLAMPAFGAAVAAGADLLRRRAAWTSPALVAVAWTTAVACLVLVLAPAYPAGPTRDRPRTAVTAQLYCANRYTTAFDAAGGRLRGLALTGRRIGTATFTVHLRVRAGTGERTAAAASTAFGEAEAAIPFAFAPLDVAPGEPVTLEIDTNGATPVSRPLLTYTRDGGRSALAVEGTPVAGTLVIDPLYEPGVR